MRVGNALNHVRQSYMKNHVKIVMSIIMIAVLQTITTTIVAVIMMLLGIVITGNRYGISLV